MLKKSFYLLIVLMLLSTGAAWAVDNPGAGLIPGDGMFAAGLAIENAQYNLASDPEERIGMQNEYAERRMLAMGQAGNPEDLEELLEGYRERERELRRLLEGLDGADGRLSTILALVAQACHQRALRLGEMIEDETLPAKAREGMQQAKENQEMAMRRLGEALARAQQARDAAQHQAGQDNNGGQKAEGPGSPSGAGRP